MSRIARSLAAARAHDRLSAEAALCLLREADLLTLGRLAHARRLHLHPEPLVTYVVDRNINYTNICVSGCLFCAFHRSHDAPDAYVITRPRIFQKIEETLAVGGTQILLQGGMHPGLPLAFYLDLLRAIKSKYSIHIHGFSPTEITFIAENERIAIEDVLSLMQQMGLDSIPGGGAEILVDRVRNKISPKKCSARKWLEVMETAHRMGIKSTATMMFGHVETDEDIIAHLMKIRDLQDKSGGFTAFIPWPFQPENTRIRVAPATAAAYLRTLAVSRLVLDNVPNLQASWVTQGAKIAQLALFYGANDLGSTMIEENVVAAAGVRFRLGEAELIRLIETAGFKAMRRDCFYNHLGAHD